MQAWSQELKGEDAKLQVIPEAIVLIYYKTADDHPCPIESND